MTQEFVQPKTLRDVGTDLWRAKTLLFFGVVLGGILAAGFIYSAKPYYKAEVTLSPANPMNGAEVSSLLADDNLFAIRYLVQRVGVANSSDFMRFENTYAGSSVAELLLQDEGIVAGLDIDRPFGFSTVEEDWDARKLSEYIQARVRMENVGSTSLRRMTYQHPSREFGAYFLHHIHRMTDELIRLKIRQGATKRVEYLRTAINDVTNPDHKRALTNLLLEQERLRMLVTIESPYAASVVEPPSVSARPAWPDPMMVFPVFMLIGAALGFVISGFTPRASVQQDAAGKIPKKPAESSGQKRGYWWKMEHGNANQSASQQDEKIEVAE